MFVGTTTAFAPSMTGPFSLAMSPAMRLSTQQTYQTQVFTDFTANLLPGQVAELKAKLEELSETESFITVLQQSLDDFDPENLIFYNPDYPYYAFLGMCQDQISVEDFTFLMRYWNASQTLNVLSLPVFSNGELIPEIKDLITATFIYGGRTEENAPLPEASLLNPKQEAEFFQRVANLSNFQKQILLIPNKHFVDSQGRHMPTVVQTIVRELGFNVFGYVNYQGESYRMIASTGMMQVFLDIKFGENAAKAYYNFGSSSNESLAAKLPYGRDFAIPLPMFPLPKTADLYAAFGDDFPWHDWYHLFVFSNIPVSEKVRLLNFFQIMQTVAKKHSQARSFCMHFYARLIDMEHAGYINHEPGDLTYLFWETLYEMIGSASFRTVLGNTQTRLMHEEFKQQSAKQTKLFLRSPFAKALARDLINNAPYYKNTYGIDICDLFLLKEPKPLYHLVHKQLMQILPENPTHLRMLQAHSEDPIRIYGATRKLNRLAKRGATV